jgi:hypothetical protein
MPHLLFNFRHVPEDEAEEVRALLREHRIDFYETQPGPWGISAGGIWTHDDEDAERGRRLLKDYARERQQRMRAEWEAERRSGRTTTFVDIFRDDPVGVIVRLAVVGFVLYLTVSLFLAFVS